jgi:putative copper export protein
MAISVELEQPHLTRSPRDARPTTAPRRTAVPGRVRLVVAAASLGATALVVASVVGKAAEAPAISDPGVITRWGLLVARTVYDLTAMGTIGVLVVAVVLLSTASGALSTESQRLVRIAGRWATAWSVAGLLSVPLVLSDVAGIPVWEVLAPDVLPLATELPQTRALLSSAWLAGLVVVGSRRCRSGALGWLLLVTGAGALLPLLLTGHTGHGDQQVAAVVGLASHVLAASVWFGGLVALGVHGRSRDVLVEALPRYSRVALACFALVAVSGVVMGWVALTEPRELLTTPYGQLLLGKTVALGALGALGHRHRRRTLPSVAAGRPRAFVRLAAVELVVMVATAGLAVGLSRTAPPDGGDHAAAVVSTETVVRAGSLADSLSTRG